MFRCLDITPKQPNRSHVEAATNDKDPRSSADGSYSPSALNNLHQQDLLLPVAHVSPFPYVPKSIIFSCSAGDHSWSKSPDENERLSCTRLAVLGDAHNHVQLTLRIISRY
jgi:hypothetical protein